MCGRFTLNKTGKKLAKELPGYKVDMKVQPRFNIAPGQPIAVILNDGLKAMTFAQWGLIPHWARDPRIGGGMINARAETAEEKPAFKTPLRRKRCLIPADGYYEWRKVAGERKKQPMYYQLKRHETFAMAGLWDEWHDKDGGLILSCTVLTVPANELVRRVHHRMPVILPKARMDDWLSFEYDRPELLQPLLTSYPSEEMEVCGVSDRMNSPAVDDAACIKPVGQMDFFE